MTRRVEVVVSFLEMDSPGALRPSQTQPTDVTLRHEPPPGAIALARELYRSVGGPWHWLERLPWSRAQWRDAIDRPGVELWTARQGETVAGYFELAPRDDGTEIRYFGLAPAFLGRGLGGWMLTEAVRRAWQSDPRRVVLNTCTLDAPAALPNYLARGFTVVRTERQMRDLPE